MERKLTQKFMSYNIAQLEKSEKESLVEMIPKLLPYNPGLLIRLIQVGNPMSKLNSESAGDKLDSYLAIEDNTYETAVLDLIREIELDTKSLNCVGLGVEDIKYAIKATKSQKVISREFDKLKSLGFEREDIMTMLRESLKSKTNEPSEEVGEDTRDYAGEDSNKSNVPVEDTEDELEALEKLVAEI